MTITINIKDGLSSGEQLIIKKSLQTIANVVTPENLQLVADACIKKPEKVNSKLPMGLNFI